MKNFYELLDINCLLSLKLELVPKFNQRPPEIILSVNHQTLLDMTLNESWSSEVKLNLLDPLNITVELKNKDYSLDHTTAVDIVNLTLDNWSVLPNYTHLASYTNDHNWAEPTSYIGFNGIWELDIKEPFYHWKHRVTGQGWLLKPPI